MALSLLVYEQLARKNLPELLKVIESPESSPAQVFWALKSCANAPTLPMFILKYLEHDHPWYREGAVRGLEPFIDDSLRDWLEKIGAIDDAQEVKDAVAEVL